MPDAVEFWTAERIALLRRLRDDGLAYAAIAARLGVTRSAISGKVDRLGLAARERMPRGPRKPRPVLKRRPVMADPDCLIQGGSPPEAVSADRPSIEPLPEAGRPSSGCGLLDLNERTCRWPVGDPADSDFFFCGELPHGEGPYCAAHRRLAYRPVDPVPVSDFEPARRPALVLQPDTRFGQFADWDVT